MATVRSINIDSAIGLEPRNIPVRSFLAGLATYWNAVREGSAAAHAYEDLVRRGASHEEAAARVFDKHFARR